MTRYKAFSLHLIASAVVLAIIFLLIQQIWYPGKLFTLAAGFDLLKLIMGVDLIIGPVIMLIIFDEKKKYIKLDVAIVIICQLGFMAYGCWTMFSSRPVYVAFVENHFYLVRANELDVLDKNELKASPFNSLPLWGPVFVGTKEPDDIKIKNDIALSSLFGVGIQNLPHYFVPYSDVTQQVLASGKTSGQLTVDEKTKQRVAEYEKKHAAREVRFLPVVNKTTPLIAVVDAKTAHVIELI